MTFYELEKRCQAKKRRFYIFILIIMIIFFLIIVFYLFLNKNEAKKNIVNSIHKVKIIKKKEKIKIESEKTKSTLKFILPDIELNSSVKENNELNASSNKVLSDKNINKIKNKEIKKEEINKTQNITLITNTIPSFETCINLSKKYLKEGNYEEALKWAKYANIQNKKNPLSWIISAKILYASGKKEEALKLLNIYNSYYNNKEIKKLIKEYNKKGH